MRLSHFKAPFIPRERIWQKADDFLARYWPKRELPVDILAIAEFDLELQFETISGLRHIADIDALLLGDLKTIIVDRDDFLEERSQNRVRYSIAHEIGHWVLHGDIVQQLGCNSVNDWVEAIQSMPEDQYTWLEQHAYEFAGRVLVPREFLVRAMDAAVISAQKAGFTGWDTSGEAALEYVAQALSRGFSVSGQVIERRLVREGLWPPARTP